MAEERVLVVLLQHRGGVLAHASYAYSDLEVMQPTVSLVAEEDGMITFSNNVAEVWRSVGPSPVRARRSMIILSPYVFLYLEWRRRCHSKLPLAECELIWRSVPVRNDL